MGKKKQPHYRIVVADSRAPRDGRFVENLGYYNPLPDPARLVVDLERVDYWVGRGAVASATVKSLVAKARAGGDAKVALGERAEPSQPPAAEDLAAEDAAQVDEPAEGAPAEDAPETDEAAAAAPAEDDPAEGEPAEDEPAEDEPATDDAPAE